MGIKFSRSQSGNWVKKAKTNHAIPLDDSDQSDEGEDEEDEEEEPHPEPVGVEYDEFQSIRNELSRYDSVHGQGEVDLFPSASAGQSAAAPQEVFDTARAVGSILEDQVDDHDLAVFSADGDTDSVQNAINSILDTMGADPQGERMQTPDLNNIAGLLDSIEAADDGVEPNESDPITEAAVSNIPQF